MTMPTGTISMNDIRTEMGTTGSINLNDYVVRSYGGSGSCDGSIDLNGFRGGPNHPVFGINNISASNSDYNNMGGYLSTGANANRTLYYPNKATSAWSPNSLHVLFMYIVHNKSGLVVNKPSGWSTAYHPTGGRIGIFYTTNGTASGAQSWSFSQSITRFTYASVVFPTQHSVSSVTVDDADGYYIAGSSGVSRSWTHNQTPPATKRAYIYTGFGYQGSAGAPSIALGGSGSQFWYRAGNQYINEDATISGNARQIGIWTGCTYRCQDADGTQQPPTQVSWTSSAGSPLAAGGAWFGLD